MIDINGAKRLLENIIRFGKYKMVEGRAQTIASFCRMITAHDGITNYVEEIRPHEEAAQKQQRARTYYGLTPYVSKKLLSYIDRLKSVEDIKITFNDFSDEEKEKVQNFSTDFHESKSIIDFAIDNYIDTQKNDPSQLLLLNISEVKDQFGDVLTRRVQPKLIGYEKQVFVSDKDGKIDIGVTKETRSVQYKEYEKNRIKWNLNTYTVTDFYLYTEGLTLILIRDTKDFEQGENIDLPPQELEDLTFELFTVEIEDNQSETYKLYTFINEGLPCPLISLSNRIDDYDRKTKTSILMSAAPQFKELIARKSELDTTINCHVFPQKYMIATKCKAESPEGHMCENGKIDDKSCGSCKGTGKNYHISSQDVITITVDPSQGLENVPDITKMVYYVKHDEFIPTFLKEEINSILATISDTIFDTNVFQGRTTVSSTKEQSAPQTGAGETATKTMIDWNKLYFAVRSDAQQIERIGELSMNFQNALLGINKKTSIAFPKDFKFEQTEELISQYDDAVKAGLPFQVLEDLLTRIIEKSNNTDSIAMRWNLLELKYKPFSDKTANEIRAILETRANDDHDRILWENYEGIMDDLRDNNPNLIFQDHTAITTALKEKTAEKFAEIKVQEATDLNNLFSNTEA